MANGIKDLNTEDQEIKDSNLGLTGDITGGQDTGDLDGDLLLSPRESKGLEAAAFATMIGQAPTTGNLIGDFFSTLAQTGPASLAAYKERLSIKEKEAEYKSQKQSLASKLQPKTYYRMVDGDLFPVVMTAKEYYAESQLNPGSLIPYFDPGKYMEMFYDNREGSDTFGQNVKYSASKAAILNEYRMKNGMNPAFLPKDEEVTVYDDNQTNFNLVKQTMKMSEFKKKFAGKSEEYMANVNTQEPGTEDPFSYKNKSTKYLDKNQRARETQEGLKPRLVAASGMLDYRKTIVDALAKQKGTTGPVKDVTLGFGNLVGFVQQGIDAFGVAMYGDKKGSQLAAAEANKLHNDRGGDQAVKNYLEKLEKQRDLTTAEQKLLDLYTGKLKPADELYASAQTIKTAVTQLVYMVAKTRESGGKFSVPDIEFAFQSIGDGSNIISLQKGIDTIMGETISSLMQSAESAYFEYGQEPLTKADLYNHPEFAPFKNIIEYDAQRRLTTGRMLRDERDQYLKVFPEGSNIYNLFKSFGEEEESIDGSNPTTNPLLEEKKKKRQF
jgi:hypothetical protein|tara:strand:+ start:29 stop:1687 length:1659 start_codon:yes stop_codon:yes gene_type:complete